MRDWWNDEGKTSTSTDGFITETELGTCAVIASKIAASAVTATKLSTDSVTTDKMTDATVTSCKLSNNALYRTVIIPFPKLAVCWGANLTSDYILYQPIVPINIQSVRIMNLAAWENATDDNVTLFRNSSACVANVARSSSTAWAIGTQSCTAATINNALIAANTVLTMQTSFSTCSVSTNGHIVIHYISTG